MSEVYFDFEERITSQLDIIRYVNLLDPDVLEMITTEYGSVEAYVKDYVARTNTMEHAYDLFVHLASCKRREQLLIIHRFGLIDGKPKTLDQVTKLFGITRERARQIERKCLKPTCTIHRTNSIRHYLKD